MNNSAKNIFVRLFVGAFGLSLWGVAAAVPMPPPPAANSRVPGTAAAVNISTPAPAPAPSYLSYTFYGDRYRDPFVPLIGGDIRNDSLYDRPPQVATLVLKGIVQDANGRVALLTSGLNSYILRSGHLYDGRNRVVKKITGVIKTDSVVLIGPDRTVRELRTKAAL